MRKVMRGFVNSTNAATLSRSASGGLSTANGNSELASSTNSFMYERRFPLLYGSTDSLMPHLHAEHRDFECREHAERSALDCFRRPLREAEVLLLVLVGSD